MVEVHLITVEPTTGNVTKTLLTLALNISLIDGPFGLRELESDLSFPPSSWNLPIRTSDIVVVLFIILFLTFAIDRYLFESRYLVHVDNATKKKDQATVQNEKAYLHEKKALNIESGQKDSSDKDRSLKQRSEDDSNIPTSTARLR